jgi:hypothetical protein
MIKIFSFLLVIALLLVGAFISADPVVLDKVLYWDPVTASYSFYDASTPPTNTNLVKMSSLHVNFSNNITGWDRIIVTADPAALKSDFQKAYYAAGRIEGYYTWESILAANYSVQGPPLTGGPGKWMEANIEWISNWQNNIPVEFDSATYQGVGRLYNQLVGLMDGINQAIADAGSSAQPWTFYDIYAYNSLEKAKANSSLWKNLERCDLASTWISAKVTNAAEWEHTAPVLFA